MNDMTSVIVPKSDQINADDLIAGPITVTIRDVQIKGGQEQPVSIALAGLEKVYRPCKSMSRVLVAMWGPDAKQYVGKSMTLYRDPNVKWGGMAVGGIRISHMSDIAEAKTMALTETRAQRKPFTVKPLANEPDDGIRAARAAILGAASMEALKTVWSSKAMAPFRDRLQSELDTRKAELAFEPEGPTDEDRGETFTDDPARTRAEKWIEGYRGRIANASSLEDLEKVHSAGDVAAAELRREFPDLYAEKLSGLRPSGAPEAVDVFAEGE